MIYFFTNDLRVHDNIAWEFFLKSGGKECIGILDESFQNERKNIRAFNVFKKGLEDLFVELQAKGFKVEILKDYKKMRGREIVMSDDTSPFAQKRLKEIQGIASKVHLFDTKHFLPGTEKKYKVFGAYYKNRLEEIFKDGVYKNLRKNTSSEPLNTPLYLEAIKNLKGFNSDLYKRSSKASIKVRSGSTNTSWAIARGIMSTREVYEYVRKNDPDGLESLVRELLFRDFYSRATLWFIKDYGDTFRNPGVVWKVNSLDDLIKKIHGAPKVIKEIYHVLLKTGNLSNYGRMLFATWVYDIGANWRLGELLFARELIDYDYSNNHWNWAHHSIQGLNYQWPERKFKIDDTILYV